MLKHNKTAAAIQLIKLNNYCFENFVYMTITLARSLRKMDYTGDIVVITNTNEYDELYLKDGIIIEKREVFDYPARHQFKCSAPGLSLYDMQKIQYWSLTNYDKVIGLDNDILAIKQLDEKFWDNNELAACAYREHINSGILFLEPSKKTFDEMYNIVTTASFGIETGWNNCGKLGIIEKWDFQAANAAQGFFPYYFHGKIHNKCRLSKHFKHFAGAAKFLDKYYVGEIEKNGFKITVPDYLE